MESYHKVTMVCVACLTIIFSLLIITVTQNTRKLIEAGYIQQQAYGSTGILWVKVTP